MKPNRTPTQSAAPDWRWALVGGLFGAVVASVAGAPARWLDSAVRLATQERVQLRKARGTVWSGSANLTLTGGVGSQDARSLPTRLSWQLGWTLSGLQLQLASDCCTPTPLQWHMGLHGGRWQLSLQDQNSRWPVEVLAGLGAPWNTLQAEGQLQWQSQGLRLHWASNQLLWHGQAQLQMHMLASRLSTVRPMGSYRLSWEGSESGSHTPRLTLHTLQGPLRLSGQGQWTVQGLRFAGEANAEEGYEAAFSNLLNIIGRRDGARSLLSLG